MIFRSPAAGAPRWPSERTAAVAFGIYLAAAVPILVSLGSHYWFMGDEWAFLVGGSIADPAVLFRSIQSHWSTLPILVYRALYTVFGLHSYLPFQLCLILLHLTLCYLLRAIMLRVGVAPWMATISAAAFVLFGAGEVNILSGVQISQVGSLVLGLAHMLLADRDGRIDRRDWLGLVCGLGSIMSSGLGPPMVAIVGLATICRRGWRPALFHTLPLAAVYVVWWKWHYTVSLTDKVNPPLEAIVRWVVHGESGVFLALGGYEVVAVALGVLLVAGLALAWAPLSLSMLRQRASLPAAMFLGALALQAVICKERWLLMYFTGSDAARSERYISICAALTLPALAVAADAVVRRWQWMMPVVCALFLVGIGLNITRFGTTPILSAQAFVAARESILAVAYSPLADQAPPDLMPEPSALRGGDADMAFLLAARDSGRLPPPPAMTTDLKYRAQHRLSLQQLLGPVPAALTCVVHAESIELNPKVGALYGLKRPVLISLGENGAPLEYNSGWQPRRIIRILRPDLKLRLAPKPPATSFELCS